MAKKPKKNEAREHRILMEIVADAYDEEEVRGETRNLLRFHPALAPVKVAVFPLVKKHGMPEVAQKICKDFKKHFNAFFERPGWDIHGEVLP